MAVEKAIKEGIFEIEKEKDFLKRLDVCKNSSSNFFKRYIYLAYNKSKKYLIKEINSDDRNILHGWMGFGGAFSEYVKRENPKKISDYMFFLEMYDRCKFNHSGLDKIYERNFKKNTTVDEILSDSKGFLLWHYQLENLIGLFLNPPLSASFRVELNRGRHYNYYKKRIKSIKVTDKLTLYDVISQRTFFANRAYERITSTRSAQWKYAYNLYNTVSRNVN